MIECSLQDCILARLADMSIEGERCNRPADDWPPADSVGVNAIDCCETPRVEYVSM